MRAHVRLGGLVTIIAVRDGMALCSWTEGPSGAEQPRSAWFRYDLLTPEMEDPATVGIFMDALREERRDPGIHLYPSKSRLTDGNPVAWFVYSSDDQTLGAGSTRGGAVELAWLTMLGERKG